MNLWVCSRLFITPTRSAIIQDISGMHAAGLATIAYYYFDFRDAEKQDCYGLLSSLLSQLSAQSDSCFKVLSQLYVDHAGGAQRPTRSALLKCLKDTLSLPGQGQIFIIVDALDECPNSSGMPSAREEVLELIEVLVDLELPNVHLCVTSRPEIDIRTVLEPLTSLKMSLHDEIGHKEDILGYIRFLVHSDPKMRKWRKEDKNLVINTLSDKGDGMYVISYLVPYRCSHHLSGFDGLSASWIGCDVFYLREFGGLWMNCRSLWT
jgi:hypothetical protein